VYLLISAGLVLWFFEQVPNWEVYLGVHLIVCCLILSSWWLPKDGPVVLQFIRDWYPVPLFLLFYKEVEVFAAAFGDWVLTDVVRDWEVLIFRGHPSFYLSGIFDWVWLSEYLHFCYFFHNIQILLIGGLWYATRRVAFQEMIFLLSVTLCVSYLFYILFPVDSPYYLATPLGAPLAGHLFYDLVHFFSARGGARGGAFPSSHVSVSVVIWLIAWYRHRGLAYVLAPITAGLIVATVYGRFHYVLDLMAGFGLACLVVGLYRKYLVPGIEAEGTVK
jgi:membrane-associated phospholipid phosphatase